MYDTTNSTSSVSSAQRFRPSDEELIVHYLGNKMKNLSRTSHFPINEAMFHYFTPDEITEFAAVCEDFGDEEWYFLVPREKRYNGKIRVTENGDGYWKATSEAKAVMNNEGVVVGFKRHFDYYHDIPGFKTNWLMTEYCIDPLITSPRRQWSLCRLYKSQYQ